jgi:tetratricopeptide (TPR) repeat protein
MKSWIWNAAAVAMLAALAFAFGSEDRNRVAPYRFPLNQRIDSDDHVAVLEERVTRLPEGLDLAALSRAYLKQARQTGKRRWIDQAEAAARRSLEVLPVSNAGAALALAQAAQMKHDFAGSIERCDAVLRERPRDPGALALKTTAQLGLGDLDGAIRTADALIHRLPLSEHFALRAVVRSARGEEREAVLDFRKAVVLEEPGDPEGSAWLRSMWARLSLRRGRPDEAEDLLSEALRIRPLFPLALGLLGDLHLDQGRLDEADRAYADAYTASGDPVFLARRARANPAAAGALRAAAERAMRESADHPLALANLLLDKGGADAVREALSIAEAEARIRRNVETLETLARARAASRR